MLLWWRQLIREETKSIIFLLVGLLPVFSEKLTNPLPSNTCLFFLVQSLSPPPTEICPQKFGKKSFLFQFRKNLSYKLHQKAEFYA